MARDFGPFPTKPMYEVVNRRMQRALAEANASTGFAEAGQGAVTAGTGAQLVIAAYPDGALVDGLWVENSASETVTLTTNSASTNPRIDRLVLRLDMAAETIAPFQIVGTPAASPSVPPLVQTATVFDMPLVQYRFPGSGSAQNPGSIVDERVWTTLPWSTFTPTLNALGGGLAEGSKTLWTSRFTQTGKTVTYEFNCTLGAGFAQGSGAFELTTPVAPATPPTAAPAGLIVGSAWLWSGSTTAIAAVRAKPNGRLEFLHHGNAANNPLTGAAAPWAWTPNATIAGSVTYETA